MPELKRLPGSWLVGIVAGCTALSILLGRGYRLFKQTLDFEAYISRKEYTGYASLLLALLGALAGVRTAHDRNGGAWLTFAQAPAFTAIDVVSLGQLKRKDLYRGPLTGVLMVLLFCRILITGAALLADWLLRRTPQNRRGQLSSWFEAGALLANTGMSAAIVNGFMVEPFTIDVTHLTIHSPKLKPGNPVRLVQLSDLHIDRFGSREQLMLDLVNRLDPDLLVLTGDYINVSNLRDPEAYADARRVLAALQAKQGVYAVRGNVDSHQRMQRIVKDTHVIWLENEGCAVKVNGQQLYIAGVAPREECNSAAAFTNSSPDIYTVLLCHIPDDIIPVSRYHPDLFLAGHTHGGQIRVPLIGAIKTNSHLPRKYSAGLHEWSKGNTGHPCEDVTMYVNRGIGFEGETAPRARFDCRPEITVFEIDGCA